MHRKSAVAKLWIMLVAALFQTAMTYSFNINHVLYCDVAKINGNEDLTIAVGKTKPDGKRDLLLKDNHNSICWNNDDNVYCQWGSGNLLFIDSEVKESRGEGNICYFLTGSMNLETKHDIPVRCTLSCQANKDFR
jgi:hypothetical protein